MSTKTTLNHRCHRCDRRVGDVSPTGGYYGPKSSSAFACRECAEILWPGHAAKCEAFWSRVGEAKVPTGPAAAAATSVGSGAGGGDARDMAALTRSFDLFADPGPAGTPATVAPAPQAERPVVVPAGLAAIVTATADLF